MELKYPRTSEEKQETDEDYENKYDRIVRRKEGMAIIILIESLPEIEGFRLMSYVKNSLPILEMKGLVESQLIQSHVQTIVDSISPKPRGVNQGGKSTRR